LAVEHVGFGYRPEEPILVDLSFEVMSGQTVAVIGVSGAGKSTLVKLCTRLYEASAGRIQLQGVDIRELELKGLRKRIVVIPQDVFLFPGTLRENLLLGADVSPARLEEALRRLGADQILARRANGLDHRVQEGGTNFSSGEKQIFALVRALICDPELLILDEATANVDPQSEILIEHGLLELRRGRTCIIIAHRLSTLTNADKIVVLQRGRVVEEGTHVQLLAKDGHYAKLYRLHTVGAPPSSVKTDSMDCR
jgi:ATP-binding cassette subfamily B protein